MGTFQEQHYDNLNANGHKWISNGISGFRKWECYMLLKYGHNGTYGLASDKEYLIELPIYPNEVSESISANWGDQKVLGRSSKLSAYANTELKSVSFSLDLHRDFLTGSFSHDQNTLYNSGGYQSRQAAGLQVQSSRGPFDTRTWYININKMLQMSCYPQYTENGLIPPTTYFIFGQMILKGFVRSYQTSWKKPIINSFYGWNSVNIQMDCYPDTIIGANEMISGDGAASTQNTYNTKYPDSSVSRSDVMTRFRDRYNARTDRSLGGSSRDT